MCLVSTGLLAVGGTCSIGDETLDGGRVGVSGKRKGGKERDCSHCKGEFLQDYLRLVDVFGLLSIEMIEVVKSYRSPLKDL